MTVGNNRISNSTVLDQINHENGDTLKFNQKDADQFLDNYVEVKNNIMVVDWLDIETRLIYHQRTPVNKEVMYIYDKPIRYRSFAPAVELKFRPWYDRGPVITVDYERSIKNVLKSNLQYRTAVSEPENGLRLLYRQERQLLHGLLQLLRQQPA